MTTGDEQAGLDCWENWQLARRGAAVEYAYEVILYSDGDVGGRIATDLGPYRVMNLHPDVRRASGRPAFVLRVDNHMRWDASRLGPMDKTSVEKYHGGTLKDELAALLSLCSGVRLKAGFVSRWFHPGDTEGRAAFHGAEPTVPLGDGRWRLLPFSRAGVIGEEHQYLMPSLPALRKDDVTALVKAARQYQEGIWVAEVDPGQAWLRLVSAAETAASQWRQAAYTPRERLELARPDLVRKLVSVGGDGFADEIAGELADVMGATKKFVEFLTTFGRVPPPVRPPDWMRCDFEEPAFKKAMRVIYGHRSKTLHDGTAMPHPMCEPPYHAADFGNAFGERPQGEATSAGGGTWTREDTPMLLWTFEHVVRTALRSWWQALAAGGEVGEVHRREM